MAAGPPSETWLTANALSALRSDGDEVCLEFADPKVRDVIFTFSSVAAGFVLRGQTLASLEIATGIAAPARFPPKETIREHLADPGACRSAAARLEGMAKGQAVRVRPHPRCGGAAGFGKLPSAG